MEVGKPVPETLLFSIIESPGHPNLAELYRRRQIREVRLTSMRKAIQALKEQRPDYVVAEFFYGYGNNYAGANLGNLDVFLASLQKYAPDARVIVMVDRQDRQYVDRLAERYPLHAVLVQPVGAADVDALLPA
jgi:DNA-binding NarL/FixJ family response regulator